MAPEPERKSSSAKSIEPKSPLHAPSQKALGEVSTAKPWMTLAEGLLRCSSTHHASFGSSGRHSNDSSMIRSPNLAAARHGLVNSVSPRCGHRVRLCIPSLRSTHPPDGQSDHRCGQGMGSHGHGFRDHYGWYSWIAHSCSPYEVNGCDRPATQAMSSRRVEYFGHAESSGDD